MRTQLPLVICFVMGVLMLAQFFAPHAISQELNRRVYDWMLVIGVFALVLGIGSLVHLHWQRVRRQQREWGYSAVVLVSLFGMAFVGIFEGYRQPARQLTPSQTTVYEEGGYTIRDSAMTLRDPKLAGRTLLKNDRILIDLEDGETAVGKIAAAQIDDDEDGRLTVTVSRWKGGTPPDSGRNFAVLRPGADLFFWFYQFIQTPLDATMFSLLAFFIASAAFRAFRARNLEAALLLISACVVILGLTPPFIYAWDRVLSFAPGLPTAAKDWILETPNMASRRAIFLGIGLGAVAQSFRIILGIERTYLGGGD